MGTSAKSCSVCEFVKSTVNLVKSVHPKDKGEWSKVQQSS